MDYKSQQFEEVYAGDKGQFDACFDTTAESAKMIKLTKKGGRIQTIAGTPTLEMIRKIGGDSCILGLVVSDYLSIYIYITYIYIYICIHIYIYISMYIYIYIS